MRKISESGVPRPTVFDLADYRREDFSVCLGCKICASVCTINDLGVYANPQDLLARLFLGRDVDADHPVVRNCMSCYRCTDACPWQIRIPEVARACREKLGVAGTFEKAFKQSVVIWGRVYEPYVMLKAAPFLVKEGYVKYGHKWMEYAGLHLFHLPRRVKRGRS